MDIQRYLNRIKFNQDVHVDYETFASIHEHHLFEVPFENLDIHYGRRFDLQLDNVYKKIVNDFRGGFCYELNFLFATLLNELGFSAKMIASRIFDEHGNAGPEYDHMSVHVTLNEEYLGDVGFGDLFLKPLQLKPGPQYDGRNFFNIKKIAEKDYVLSMSSDGINYQAKYTFNLTETSIGSFGEMCIDKQTNPDSYFVKNTICTKPTNQGRVTLFNSKLIEKRNEERIITMIADGQHLRDQLKERFGIVL
jgi:N-hydroxyarylamine O-acetyltransferase